MLTVNLARKLEFVVKPVLAADISVLLGYAILHVETVEQRAEKHLFYRRNNTVKNLQLIYRDVVCPAV